jgi:urease accessory protein
MTLVRGPLAGADPALPACPIRVDRLKLAKRLWRATAADGTDFGFEVNAPLRHGEVVHVTAAARYVIEQQPEPVLALALDPHPDASAVLGWIVGNLHFVIEARADVLLAPDDPALRQSLERLGIAYEVRSEVFQPHRLAASVVHSHAGAGPGDEHPYLRPPALRKS